MVKSSEDKRRADVRVKKACVVKNTAPNVDPAEKFDLGNHFQRVMAACGVSLGKNAPIVLHTHCSGADAPVFALKAMGAPLQHAVASECALAPAAFHAQHHRAEHLFSSAKHGSSLVGPCLKHGGKKCKARTETADILAASFSCTPYSRQRSTRSADPVHAPGETASNDTYFFIRDAIKQCLPKYFVLENVEGMLDPRTKDDKSTALDFVLDDPEYGLRSIGSYDVDYVSNVTAFAGSLPQSRPRVLLFGVHTSTGKNAKQVTDAFRLFAEKSNDKVYHAESFLQATCQSMPLPASTDLVSAELDYIMHFKAEMKKCKQAGRAAVTLKASGARVSDAIGFRHLSGRMRATIDILEEHSKQDVRKFIDNGGDSRCVHVIADISQSTSRKVMRIDGSFPTTCTSSVLVSFKLNCMIALEDIACSMGYPRGEFTLQNMNMSDARKMLGNGYATTVAGMAMMSVLMCTGHLVESRE